MTLTEARDFLRAELLAVAAAAVPGYEGVVTHDPGPVNPHVLSDGSGPDMICSITVENGDPEVIDPAGQVAAAAAALTPRGLAGGGVAGRERSSSRRRRAGRLPGHRARLGRRLAPHGDG